ncbi:MAG: rRNA maturation RNase YbeY [Candidatus Omnitrophica bacterium]|nr:rRNA maturation RNase YbeY [Candidatus Omnitrophota bacterium]
MSPVIIQSRQKKISVDLRWIRKATHALCRYHNLLASKEITVVLVSDRAISRLNAQYLSRPQPTDVLAFELGPDMADIIISVETAQRQAKSFRHSLEEEVLYLIIHGLLHLQGFKDSHLRSRKKMLGQQARFMRMVMKAISQRE